MQQVIRKAEIGDGAVVTAGGAERLGLISRHQPVADAIFGIGAEAVALAGRRERAPEAVDRFEGGDDRLFRQVAQPQPAALAAPILEIERLAAVLAFEQLHAIIVGWVGRKRNPSPLETSRSSYMVRIRRWVLLAQPVLRCG